MGIGPHCLVRRRALSSPALLARMRALSSRSLTADLVARSTLVAFAHTYQCSYLRGPGFYYHKPRANVKPRAVPYASPIFERKHSWEQPNGASFPQAGRLGSLIHTCIFTSPGLGGPFSVALRTHHTKGRYLMLPQFFEKKNNRAQPNCAHAVNETIRNI